MKKYNCIVIGAGSIGAMKPDNIDSPISVNILTHAHAIKHSEELDLLGIIDSDINKCNTAFEKWDVFTYESISSIYNNNDLHLRITSPIDIVTIATPTETHFRVIEEVIEKIKPKIIICEKPFCDSIYEAEQAIKQCEENKIKLIVHYNRRYCGLFGIANAIHEEYYGKVLSCVLTYTRGLKRDGCHAIDLFNLMFGEFINGYIISVFKDSIIADHSEKDLTYPVYLQYEKCPNIFMVPHDGRDFSVFDFKILTEKAEILITNHGADLVINYATKEKVYGNFQSLDYFNERTFYKMHMTHSLINIYSECVSYLNEFIRTKRIGDFDFSSPATDAIKVHKIFKHLGV